MKERYFNQSQVGIVTLIEIGNKGTNASFYKIVIEFKALPNSFSICNKSFAIIIRFCWRFLGIRRSRP